MKPLQKISLIIISLFLIYSCDENNNTDDGTVEPEKQIQSSNFTGPTESFGDFVVYKLLNQDSLNISLRILGIGREPLNLTSDPTTFSLPTSDLTVDITEWDKSVLGYFSNDAVVIEEIPTTLDSWDAISGTINLSVSNIETNTNTNFTTYDITIVLENVIFENEDGEQRAIENLSIENAFVGWLPG